MDEFAGPATGVAGMCTRLQYWNSGGLRKCARDFACLACSVLPAIPAGWPDLARTARPGPGRRVRDPGFPSARGRPPRPSVTAAALGRCRTDGRGPDRRQRQRPAWPTAAAGGCPTNESAVRRTSGTARRGVPRRQSSCRGPGHAAAQTNRRSAQAISDPASDAGTSLQHPRKRLSATAARRGAPVGASADHPAKSSGPGGGCLARMPLAAAPVRSAVVADGCRCPTLARTSRGTRSRTASPRPSCRSSASGNAAGEVCVP
jgi:hypothetical protein